MTQRIDYQKQAPDLFKKFAEFGNLLKHSSIEETIHDLVNIRASQINGCTFCVDMHSVDLQGRGFPLRKVFAVAAWRESPWFDERERIALELTEAVTLVHEGGVGDDLYERAVAEFGETGFANLVLAIGTINIWNRIAIPTRMRPPAL